MQNQKIKIHKAKKSLGQNFLKSVPALHAIINAGEIKSDDIVLEIGPGKGALTEKILEAAGKVIAVEKDDDLFAFLQEKFSEEIKNKKLILLNQDILELNIEHEIEHGFLQVLGFPHQKSPSEIEVRPDHSENHAQFRYKIIANIPYNITGAILKKFLTDPHQPERMVLMVQNEVAKRIVANDKKESILSISVKAYGTPKFVMKVPARYFSPAPKVDSAVISITNISRKFFESEGSKSVNLAGRLIVEEKFWELVKSGFAHKRKLLSGNLKNIISSETLASFGLQNKRAENLQVDDWIKLSTSTQPEPDQNAF